MARAFAIAAILTEITNQLASDIAQMASGGDRHDPDMDRWMNSGDPRAGHNQDPNPDPVGALLAALAVGVGIFSDLDSTANSDQFQSRLICRASLDGKKLQATPILVETLCFPAIPGFYVVMGGGKRIEQSTMQMGNVLLTIINGIQILEM